MNLLIATVGAVGLVLLFSGLTQRSRRRPRPRLLDGLDRLAAEAGYRRLRGGGLLAISAVAGSAGFVLASTLTPLWLLHLGTGLGGGYVPVALALSRRSKLRNALRHAWPDVIADLISGVRAGLSLAECCTSLGERAPEQLRGGFAAFASAYGASGSFETGLQKLQDTLEDPVADRVVAVLRITNEVGGNDLVRVLRTSAELIRDDLRIRGEIQARWSWTVTAARLAVGAPFVVLLMMSSRPEAAAAYATPAGTVTIVVGGVACFVGYRLMLRAATLPEERRIR